MRMRKSLIFSAKQITTTWAQYTNCGSRLINEDSIIASNNGRCFVVADGLGGHNKGEIASRIACDVIMDYYEKNMNSFDVIKAVELANEKINTIASSKKDYEGMKTTVNIVHIGERYIDWTHIGDTRTYFIKNNRIVARTYDHSVAQMLVDSGQLEEKDIRYNEDRNRLLKALGRDESIACLAEKPIKIKKQIAYLMCTDGFWEYILEKDIVLTLNKANNPKEWLDQMVDIINRNGKTGKMDNLSAIAGWIE